MCNPVVGVFGVSDHIGECMMGLIRNWLIGITASAMIAAMADSLAPSGVTKKFVKLSGGLLIMLSVLQPLGSLEYSDMSEILLDYRIQSEAYSAGLETENIQLIKTIIEEDAAAYIQDKAAELGIECEADVACLKNEEEMPYPASVIVYGELEEGQIHALGGIIERDLAIAAENQHYERAKKS